MHRPSHPRDYHPPTPLLLFLPCLPQADRLLDMGFRPSLDRIVAALPSNKAGGDRQTVLFSATVSRVSAAKSGTWVLCVPSGPL
jgi:hypothetical protein